jgi:hypothetical protein
MMTTTITTRAFYVRFQVPIATRAEAPAAVDRFMNAFVGYLETLGLGPTGDISPAGSGVFLILGIDRTAPGVIVDVKDGDPGQVTGWFGGVPELAYEVGPVVDIEIDSKAEPLKEKP